MHRLRKHMPCICNTLYKIIIKNRSALQLQLKEDRIYDIIKYNLVKHYVELYNVRENS